MNTSLYFHVPFCKKRCHYCDFYTTTGTEALIPTYVDGLIKEFRVVTRSRVKIPVHSIYFGGGTPSLISVNGYQRLLVEISHRFDLCTNCEISLEANPGTLSPEYLEDLQSLGFNRISLGVQSTDAFDLTRLDRIHSIDDVLSSLNNARKAGFNNISLDLIFGLPWQDLESWKNSLERAIQLRPEHLSVYSLIIEPATPLYYWYLHGLIEEKDQDLEGEMYEYAISRLESAGYEHYEISNWRKRNTDKDYRCLHNLQYWRNQPYFGFGASAHGYVDGVRIVNSPNLVNYLERVKNEEPYVIKYPGSLATVSMDVVDRETRMKDFMMLGLRLVREGVSEKRFQSLYGESMRRVFNYEISTLITQKLVEWGDGDQRRLRLTPRGIMVANQVFMQFV